MKKRRQLINPDTRVLLKQIGIGIIVIVTVALLVTGVWYGTRLAPLTISQVSVEGGKTIDLSEIAKLANKQLEGSYIGIIPRRFTWFFPKKEIISSVQSVDRLHNVTVDNVSRTEILVTFDEYLPKALWCATVESDDCLFLDSEGYAFGKAPRLSGGSFLRFIASGEEPLIGNTIIDNSLFLSQIRLSELLAEHGWFVSHIEFDQVGDVFLGIVSGGELKVIAAEPPESIVENLLTILASDEFSHIKPGNFQYIDLRFGNKVFVNEEPADLQEDTAGVSVATSTDDF
ncbi:hypothetical protein H6785_01685 [Candidatus Nomurabacteria bacterium]|nr:hypothetical protein [Candidatus Kaiserbacteria bacterium]MCB9815274.1 hypothetical protein [Candidatus Nomurabacteria bacterium]